MKIVAWNVERKRPSSPTGSAGVRRIASESPDVVVLTEARLGHLADLGGHEAASQQPVGDRFAADERKIVIWSREPWRDVDSIGDADLPHGRFVAGTTSTPLGDVRVIGVCIPWHMCDVNVGSRDRSPWEQHLRWLELFEPLIADPELPVVIAGDFNQRVPGRKGGRRDIAELLARVFTSYPIVTAGVPDGLNRQGIDHIAVDQRLEAALVRGWAHDDGGTRMSDHDAVVAELRLRD